MANKLIDELIIKVRQQGAKPTEKAIRAVAEALEEAKEAGGEFNKELSIMPDYLKQVEKSALKTAKGLQKVKFNFSSAAAEKSLSNIEQALEALVSESLDTNDILTKMNNNMIRSFDNLANSLGADMERVQDGLMDVEKQAGKTGQAFEGMAKQQKRQARGTANQNRQGRNQARTFSDLAKAAGPLPLLYANIAANAFALSEAFRLISEGEQLNRLEEVGNIIGGQIGIPVQSVAKDMQELTGHTISYGESMRLAAAAASYGFDSTQIEQMTMAARRASIALGVDMQDAMNRVIRGVSKLEIELLDELGITTKLTTAYENYAKEIGASADSLNSYQQRAALVNEINTQSVEKLGMLDEMLSNGAPWEKFGANMASSFQTFFMNIAEATAAIPEFFNKITERDKNVKESMITSKNLVDSFAESLNRGGKVGLLIEAQSELERFQARLEHINNTVDLSKMWGKPIKTEVNNLKAAIRRLEELNSSGVAALGVPSLERASEAYKSLNSAVKGSKLSYETGLAAIRGQATEYEKLYSEVTKLVDAYRAVERADPGATSKDNLRALGFESEAAANRAQYLAKAYRDASRDLAVMNNTIAQNNLWGRMKGEPPEISKVLALNQQLVAYRKLLKAQQGLGVNDTIRAKTAAEIAKIEYQLVDAKTALHDRDTAIIQERKRQERAGQPGLLLTKDLLEVEKESLRVLQLMPGTYMAREQALTRIKQLENDIAAAQLAQSMELYGSALGDLVSYTTGLDQLTGSLNTLALSFNNMGESSLTATQMTSMGLQAFQGVLQYTSSQAIGAIDAQINAEKKRDGKSQESLAKIKALEAKKIKEQKKAAQKQILISTAVAVMNAAANPWPIPAIPLMATAALAGGLAYQQASSAASNSLSSLGSGDAASSASLTMGSRDNKVDVSGRASQGELSYVRGEAGIGNINSFSPRAAGGIGTPGVSFLAGENGPELITPLEPLQVTDSEDTAKMAKGSQRALIDNMNIHAMDAQSIIDRAPEIYEAFAKEAEQRGQDVNNLY